MPTSPRLIDWRSPHLGPSLAQARATVTDPARCAANPGLCVIAWAALHSARGDTGFQRRLIAMRSAEGGAPWRERAESQRRPVATHLT
jgi:hypothetical protein